MIGSLAGFIGLPQSPVYSATKAAVRIYGDGLRRQLARNRRYGHCRLARFRRYADEPLAAVPAAGSVDGRTCRRPHRRGGRRAARRRWLSPGTLRSRCDPAPGCRGRSSMPCWRWRPLDEAAMTSFSGIRIERVEHRRHERDWLRVPHVVLADDPHWVAPLNLTQAECRRDAAGLSRRALFQPRTDGASFRRPDRGRHGRICRRHPQRPRRPVRSAADLVGECAGLGKDQRRGVFQIFNGTVLGAALCLQSPRLRERTCFGSRCWRCPARWSVPGSARGPTTL